MAKSDLTDLEIRVFAELDAIALEEARSPPPPLTSEERLTRAKAALVDAGYEVLALRVADDGGLEAVLREAAEEAGPCAAVAA